MFKGDCLHARIFTSPTMIVTSQKGAIVIIQMSPTVRAYLLLKTDMIVPIRVIARPHL